VIASIEEQAVIDKILNQLMKKGALAPPPELLPATQGLTRFRLVCLVLGFHTSLNGTATER
jgi:hypothetical protein